MTKLNCDDLRHTLKSGATLLDVRNTHEFDAGCLPNAKNIPLSILPVLADEHFEKNDTLLIYCHSGGRAVMAERVLAGMGFTNIVNIGGIQHYSHCH
jgi:rhodanese-related sulfurtransferase